MGELGTDGKRERGGRAGDRYREREREGDEWGHVEREMREDRWREVERERDGRAVDR